MSDAFDNPSAHNNFNLLRFLAASLVVYTHCYGLSGQLPKPQDYFAYFVYRVGNIGVDVFFIISGFLVTKSYLNRNRLWTFIKARSLRLYPGLCCALLFALLVIGPINTTLPLKTYFQHPQLSKYFLYNISFSKTILELPEVFAHNVYRYNVNGSLWTLPAEARMYILLALCGVCGLLAKRSYYTLTLALACLIYIVDQTLLPLIADNPLYYRLSGLFFSGSLLYVYRHWIPQQTWIFITACSVILLSYLFFETYVPLFYALLLPYITLWLAFNLPWLNGFNRLGDYSYGIYIYAFPIQQTIVSHWPTIDVISFFYLSLGLTLLLAIPSWHWIEKPALSYKG